MSKYVRTVLSLMVALLFVTSVALAQKTKTLNIYSDAVLPSGQELKAGKYQVAVDETSKQVSFTQNKKVVATTGCTVVEKPEKNPCDSIRYDGNKTKPQLQELRFGGEHRSILLIH